MATNPNYIVLVQQYSAAGSTAPSISVQAPIPDQVAFDLESTYEPLLPQGFTSNKFLNLASAGFGVRLAVQSLTAQLWTGNTAGDLSLILEFHTESDPIADVRNPIVNLMKLVTPAISSSTGLLQSPGPQLDLSQLGSIAEDAIKDAATSVVSVVGAGAKALANVFSNGFGSSSNAQPATMVDTGKQDLNATSSVVPQALQQNPQLGTADYWKSQISNRISIRLGNYLYFDNVVIIGLSSTFMSAFDANTGLPHHVQVTMRFRPMFVLSQTDIDNIFINPGANGTPGSNNFGFTLPPGIPNANTNNSFGVGNNSFGFTA